MTPSASITTAMPHPGKTDPPTLTRTFSDARKLKALEEENRKLKKLLAETMLDASTLKEMLGKNF